MRKFWPISRYDKRLFLIIMFTFVRAVTIHQNFHPFQACTGIEDVGEALMYLENADWHLTVMIVLIIVAQLYHFY